MEILRWKARLSVLWVFLAVITSAYMILILMSPGVIEDIIIGQFEGTPITGGFLAFWSIFWLIPLIIAALCFSLKDSANRWLNFIMGIIFVLFYISDTIQRLIQGEPLIAQGALDIAAPVVAAFIAWFAWRLPKQEA
jgi:hypothetical protein